MGERKGERKPNERVNETYKEKKILIGKFNKDDSEFVYLGVLLPWKVRY
jgi:hypothetical protein